MKSPCLHKDAVTTAIVFAQIDISSPPRSEITDLSAEIDGIICVHIRNLSSHFQEAVSNDLSVLPGIVDLAGNLSSKTHFSTDKTVPSVPLAMIAPQRPVRA